MKPMLDRRRWLRLGQLSTITADTQPATVGYQPDVQCILLNVPPATLAAFEQAAGDPALIAAIDLPAGEIPWRADTFMLVDTDTSDRRRFLADGGGHRDLPLPLMASLVTTYGHEGAVSVGRITELNMGNPTVSAAGMFDDSDEARDVIRKIASQSVTGISADLAVFDADFELLLDDEDMVQVATNWEVMGGTVTPFPAFAEAQITVKLQADDDEGDEPDDADEPDDDEETDALTVAAFDDLPLADRERAWDATAAEGTLRTLASSDGSGDAETIDWDAYFRGFLYRDADDAESFGGYSLGFAEVVDDTLQAVPRGLFAVAGVLQGGRGGADIPEADQERIRGVVAQYYAKMADEFDDDSIVVPWEAAARPVVAELRPALVAAVPLRPSGDWFANPGFSRPTPPVLTDDGRYFGHATTWEQCHIGFTDRCVTAEPSQVGYANFLTGYIETDGDGPRATGIVSMFGGHADLSFDYLRAIRHYDDASTAVAQVAVGDDAFGVWFAGCVMPGVTDEEMTLLRALQPSGDWRPIGGHRELVALLAVNHPGFPVARVASASGDCGECVPDELRVAARYHAGELVALVAGAGAVDLARAVAERERPVSRAEHRALTSRLAALEAGFARHDPTVSALDPLARAELRRRIS